MPLADRIGRHQFCPYRFNDVKAADVLQVVFGKIAPGQSAVVTDQRFKAGTSFLEDWIGMSTRVQKMGMTVDDGDQVCLHGSPAAHLYSKNPCASSLI
jgi:hypothetical protein